MQRALEGGTSMFPTRILSMNLMAVLLVLTAWVAPGFARAAGDDRDQENAGRITLSTGIDLSSGDYGQVEDTDIWYVPLALKYERGPWIGKVTVPFIRIEGAGDVVGGVEGPIIIGGGGAQTREQGLGDVIAALSYVLYPSTSFLPVAEFTGKVKFATADEDEALGTGENDYTAQLDLSKALGRLTPFGTVGYRWIGEPSGVELDDVFFASAGLGLKITNWLSAGVIYDFKQASSDAADDSRELVTYLSLKISDALTLGSYTVIGLSDSSPDLGLGVNVSVSW